MKYIVVGLGNPGEKYHLTRHNAGQVVLKRIVASNSLDFNIEPWREKKSLPARTTSGRSAGGNFELILPDVYMNLSGEVVKKIPGAYEPEALIVFHDELDLPYGQFKISFGRSAGGHNGVESIIRSLGTKKFLRFRIGIGPDPHPDQGFFSKIFKSKKSGKDYVLGKFKDDEINKLINLVPKIKEAFLMVMDKGKEVAMNKFN